MNWALGRLLSKADRGGGDGYGAVDKLDAMAGEVGSGEHIRRALSVVEGVERDLASMEGARRSRERLHEGSLEDIMEEDSRMDE